MLKKTIIIFGPLLSKRLEGVSGVKSKRPSLSKKKSVPGS